MHSSFSECQDSLLWEQFIKNLVYSYNHGCFNSSVHGEMLVTASCLNASIDCIKEKCSFVDISTLPYLFVFIPRYVLAFHIEELITGINNCEDSNIPFYSVVYPKHLDYSNWLMAGIHRLLKYIPAIKDEAIRLFYLFNHLHPGSPFLKNLTFFDIEEFYKLYCLDSKTVCACLDTTTILTLLVIDLIRSDKDHIVLALQKCLEYEKNPVRLFSLILSVMNHLNLYVFILLDWLNRIIFQQSSR